MRLLLQQLEYKGLYQCSATGESVVFWVDMARTEKDQGDEADCICSRRFRQSGSQ
jgi:hypothetical protein